jgi:streptomycin 6-kinase
VNVEARLRAWGAEPTGETWRTRSSELAAGVRGGLPVILKAAGVEEERRGGRLMAWWSGCGGLPVLEADEDAILMRRASRDLLALPAADAEQVLLETALALHAMPPPPAAVGLVPLRRWFRDLVARPQSDPLLAGASDVARALLAGDGPSVVLHGDLHHGNVLDLDGRWVAIDPKALVGHPAFDVANVFCNPSEEIALTRLDDRLARFAERLSLEPEALARWVVAWCGLSLAWSDGSASWHARTARAVATQLLPRLR